MFVDNPFQSIFFREVFFVFFKMNNDTGTPLLVLSFRDRISALAIAFPLETSGRFIPRVCINFDLCSRHESRIKPDPELTNH